MAGKLFSEEDILGIFHQIELELVSGGTLEALVRAAGISDATYYKWCKTYGGMGNSKLHEFKSLKEENARLKRIVADLELDKLMLKESLDYLKPKACRLPICVRQ